MKKSRVKKISIALMKRGVLFFALFLFAMNFLAFLAPVLAHLGFERAAHVIYYIYGFFCHQRPWRSIHLYDYQVAWCTRDVFIYFSMAVSILFVYKFNIRKVAVWFAVLSIFPFAIDGIIQLIAEIRGIYEGKEVFFYASTNFQRMLTGSIFGAGAGLWLFAMLHDTIQTELVTRVEGLKAEVKNFSKYFNLKIFLLTIFVSFVFYLFIVQVWKATSDKYKPSGLIDQVRYFPGVNYEETGRRGHAT